LPIFFGIIKIDFNIPVIEHYGGLIQDFQTAFGGNF